MSGYYKIRIVVHLLIFRGVQNFVSDSIVMYSEQVICSELILSLDIPNLWDAEVTLYKRLLKLQLDIALFW